MSNYRGTLLGNCAEHDVITENPITGSSKRLRGEAREKSVSGGVLCQYVGARRFNATKHMRLFQQLVSCSKQRPRKPAPACTWSAGRNSQEPVRKDTARRGVTP